MSNLQQLDWFDGGDNYGDLEGHSPTHAYIISDDRNKCKVTYMRFGDRAKEALGFADITEAKEWAWNHYNEKMQPYVKPSPTWIDAKKHLPQVDFNTQFICKYDSAIEPYVRVATFSAAINEFDYGHDSVLAWMPIPEFKESDCE